MPHVIAEPCIGTKDTSCVDVCPVDCIHPTKNEPEFATAEMLYIDPDTCIDCGLCVDECPVGAIFPEEDVPAGQEPFLAINAELATQWPVLAVKKPALADAQKWDGVPDKLRLLIRSATGE